MKLALLSTDRLPRFLGANHPDEVALFSEDDVLRRCLSAYGIESERVSWRSHADWRSFDAVLLRSTWDYIDDPEGFLSVLHAIQQTGCRLTNPVATVKWNLDKRYLLELVDKGIPVVPTVAISKPEELARLDNIGWPGESFVVKPTVGVGGFGMRRLDSIEAVIGAATTGLEQGLLVQPFLQAIVEEGEWSFVFANGRFCYAAVKKPKDDDYRVQVMYGARTEGKVPDPRDLESAVTVFESLPVEAAYARIDMVRGDQGRLLLMEAELIEPQLYFIALPRAADAFARAISKYFG